MGTPVFGIYHPSSIVVSSSIIGDYHTNMMRFAVFCVLFAATVFAESDLSERAAFEAEFDLNERSLDDLDERSLDDLALEERELEAEFELEERELDDELEMAEREVEDDLEERELDEFYLAEREAELEERDLSEMNMELEERSLDEEETEE